MLCATDIMSYARENMSCARDIMRCARDNVSCARHIMSCERHNPPPQKKIWCHIYTTVEKNPKIPLMVSGAKVNMESGLLGTKKFVHRRYNDVKNSIDIRTFSLVA